MRWCFFFSSRRRHTRWTGDWSSDVCSSDLGQPGKLTLRPANLPVEQAATVGVSALTALQAIRDRGHVQTGQHVLVIGASGGVGTFAVQIAKAYGAEVTGVSS